MLIEGLDSPLIGPDDVVILEEGDKPLTLRSAIKIAMLSFNGKEEISGVKKFEYGEIASKVKKAEGDTLELTLEELKEVKDRTGIVFFSPAIVWAIYKKIDPKKS